MLIAPSILNCEEEKLNEYLQDLEALGITWIHLDIMDGIFVPNSTKLVERMKDVKGFKFVNDTHLMVQEPTLVYRDYAKEGSDYITVHQEANVNIEKLAGKIHSMGKKVGVSIKPNTPVSAIVDYLPHIDLVLIMSVEPGKGGQKFIDSTYEKVEHLNILREENLNFNYLIEVDGGVNRDNIENLAKAGCDIVVMGTALLKEQDKKGLIDLVHNL